MKKFTVALLALAMLVLNGCNKTDSPETTVTKFFTALTDKKYEDASMFTDIPIFNPEMEDMERELYNKYFSSMSVTKPVVITKDASTAVIAVEITAIDLDSILQTLFAEALQIMQDNPDADVDAAAEDLDKKFIAALELADAPKKTITAELEIVLLEKDKKKRWAIMSDTAEAAIFLQEPQKNLDDYDYDRAELGDTELLYTETTVATFMGSDDVAGLCAFFIGEEISYLYCDDIQLSDLSKNYMEKELEIVYEVYGNSTYEQATGDTSARLLVLVSYK